MRPDLPALILILLAGLTTGGCAAMPDRDRAVRPVCDPTSSCFYQRQVRSFEVLDDETVVVLVGSQRCAYLVRVDGFFCNLRAAPYIIFQDMDGRICANDRSYVTAGPFVRREEVCRIYDVTAINDDELMETYAEYGRAQPLPPVGSGDIEVERAEAEGSEDPSAQPEDLAGAPGLSGTVGDSPRD